MNKNVLLISGAIVIVILSAIIVKITFTGFSKSLPDKEIKEDIISKPAAAAIATVKESRQLQEAKELAASGQRAEAIKQLEGIIDKHSGSKESCDALKALADIFEKDNNLIKVKELYTRIINDYPQFCDYAQAQKKIASLNMDILFSNIVTPESELYTIMPGDSLAKIANKYSTTIELIKRANNLKSDIIMPYTKLKVQSSPFTIIVDNTQCVLTVLLGDQVIKTYDVATGKNNSTPIGTFKIKDKLIDPVWYNKGTAVPAGSPDNVLGTRWMGLTTEEPGYGIHGTTAPESIGYQSTEGCVRMRNSDVEELYSIIPVGTEVTIIQ
jgi:lipoprotein-anchoring transpeptidase ErfK/SrfK